MPAHTLEALINIQAFQNQDAEDRYIADGGNWYDYEGLLAKREGSPGGRLSGCQAKMRIASQRYCLLDKSSE